MDELALIIDDNEMNLRLARDVLRYGGFRTVEGSTGAAALTLAREHRPDVILLDIRLPDMDGTEVLARLKRGEETSAIPVVALTSFAMNGDRERLLAEGFDGYLAKPIAVRAFPEQVRSHCAPPGSIPRST